MDVIQNALAKVKAGQTWEDHIKGVRRALRKAGLEYQRQDFVIAFPTENRHVVFQKGPPVTYEILPGIPPELSAGRKAGGKKEPGEAKEPRRKRTQQEKREARRNRRAGSSPNYPVFYREKTNRDVLNEMINELTRLLKVHIAQAPGKSTWLTFNAALLYQIHPSTEAVAAYLEERFAARQVTPTHLALMSMGTADNYLIGFGPLEKPHAYHEDVEGQPVRDLPRPSEQ